MFFFLHHITRRHNAVDVCVRACESTYLSISANFFFSLVLSYSCFLLLHLSLTTYTKHHFAESFIIIICAKKHFESNDMNSMCFRMVYFWILKFNMMFVIGLPTMCFSFFYSSHTHSHRETDNHGVETKHTTRNSIHTIHV